MSVVESSGFCVFFLLLYILECHHWWCSPLNQEKGNCGLHAQHAIIIFLKTFVHLWNTFDSNSKPQTLNPTHYLPTPNLLPAFPFLPLFPSLFPLIISFSFFSLLPFPTHNLFFFLFFLLPFPAHNFVFFLWDLFILFLILFSLFFLWFFFLFFFLCSFV